MPTTAILYDHVVHLPDVDPAQTAVGVGDPGDTHIIHGWGMLIDHSESCLGYEGWGLAWKDHPDWRHCLSNATHSWAYAPQWGEMTPSSTCLLCALDSTSSHASFLYTLFLYSRIFQCLPVYDVCNTARYYWQCCPSRTHSPPRVWWGVGKSPNPQETFRNSTITLCMTNW